MYSAEDILSFTFALGVIFIGLLILRKMREGDAFRDRLKDLKRHQNILTGQQETASARAYKRNIQKSANPFINLLNQIQFRSAEEQDKVKKMFSQAGWRSEHAMTIYLIVKLLAIFPPAVGAYVYAKYFTEWATLMQVAAVLGAALIGSMGVDKFVESKIKSRQEKIQKAFPDALDLMVICTEAGLSLNATLQRVAREVGPVSPELGYELAITSIEMNMLPDRKMALQNFSNRLDIPAFKGIVSTLIQSEQYGTPIAQTMRVISEEFRAERILRAEEKASRLPVMLTLPLALFILPCIFIVILGPAAISISNSFK